MAQKHHHDSLSQHTSQYSCSNDETERHDPEPKHNSETASQHETKHNNQQNQWNKQHQLNSSANAYLQSLADHAWFTGALDRCVWLRTAKSFLSLLWFENEALCFATTTSLLLKVLENITVKILLCHWNACKCF